MIACYGEALIDLFVSPYSPNSLRTDSQACLGGSVFNFCLAVQRQGLHSLYLNALSMDSFGRQFARVLQEQGIVLDAKPCLEPTSIAVIELDAQGKATYAFHRIGVADTARRAADIVAQWQPEVKILHTGCLMLMPETWPQTQRVITHAAKNGCVVSVDANVRPAVEKNEAAYASCVKQACEMAHVVKVSDDDLVAMGELPASDIADVQLAARAARKLLSDAAQTKLVALTLGARGAWLLTREHSIFQAALTGVQVKDTVGAGDSFAAALLAYLSETGGLTVAQLTIGLSAEALKAALRHAVAASALCVQRVGCDPANWEEAERLAAELQ